MLTDEQIAAIKARREAAKFDALEATDFSSEYEIDTKDYCWQTHDGPKPCLDPDDCDGHDDPDRHYWEVVGLFNQQAGDVWGFNQARAKFLEGAPTDIDSLLADRRELVVVLQNLMSRLDRHFGGSARNWDWVEQEDARKLLAARRAAGTEATE